MGNQLGITHLRGSECDLLIRSNRETTHYIHSLKQDTVFNNQQQFSRNIEAETVFISKTIESRLLYIEYSTKVYSVFGTAYPLMYPANTTCTFIIDGLQGEQNLEEVILTFEKFAVLTETVDRHSSISYDEDDEPCATSYVGIAFIPTSIKSVLSSGEESNYDAVLCDRIQDGSNTLGPYISDGPRMVLVFSSHEKVSDGDGLKPLGFKAKIKFKTDFGISGKPVGDSNQCMFQFTKPQGWFNSPRYPANYPLDTNCTYIIKAKPDEQIQVYFEQFALYVDEHSSAETSCADFLEISDVFVKNGVEILQLQARYCANTFLGPTVTAFGSHELRVFSSLIMKVPEMASKQFIRFAKHSLKKSRQKAINYKDSMKFSKFLAVPRHCGQRIARTDDLISGWFVSPGYPIKYNKDLICDWEITVRPNYQILLHLVKMEIEGSMTAESVNCQNAVIRVDAERSIGAGPAVQEICGTDETIIPPIISKNNTVRIRILFFRVDEGSLYSSATTRNSGLVSAWVDTMDDSECSDPSLHLCTYTKLCIDARLKCNGDENCGLHDDTDEAHCNKLENAVDVRTVLLRQYFPEEKDKRRRHAKSGMRHQRTPFRNPRPITKADPHLLPAPAASRLTHHNVTTDIISSSIEQRNEKLNGETSMLNPSKLTHS
ncbi:CUB domain protein [Dirofilaria immitis]|nr:CUB domain protein [Dirofilaria immitis]